MKYTFDFLNHKTYQLMKSQNSSSGLPTNPPFPEPWKKVFKILFLNDQQGGRALEQQLGRLPLT